MGRPDFSRGIPVTSLQGRLLGAWNQDGHFGGGQLAHNAVKDASAGGSATVGNDFTTLTTDATAGEHAHVGIVPRAFDYSSGIVLGWFGFRTNQKIENLGEKHQIGFVSRTAGPGHRVVFEPDVGNQTDGNVLVNRNGNTEKTGQVEFLDVRDGHHYAILIDYAAGETRFFVESDPFNDVPDATIELTPSQILPAGATISTTQTDAAEELHAIYAGYRYAP
jgi:hypothetical protein